jgi:hydroxyethylthiazole kinase
MDRVTAMGCACSALLGAFLALGAEPFEAVAGGVLAFGVAGELAAARARGPGTFVPEFLDALYALDEDLLLAHAKVSP